MLYLYTKKALKKQNNKAELKDIELMKKNGFAGHFDMKQIPDTYNTTIPYKVFDVHDITRYGEYLTTRIFSRTDLPNMTAAFKRDIQDYLLEVFQNVYDHTTSERIYTCGQFFPKGKRFHFTLVDTGETIPYNVFTYFETIRMKPPSNPLQWALQTGNSTADKNGPRGMGLSLVRDFIFSNNGQLYIVSGHNTYEINNGKEHYKMLSVPFTGTIVTLVFNLNDTSLSSTDEQIQF